MQQLAYLRRQRHAQSKDGPRHLQSLASQQTSQSRVHLWASSMRLSASSRYRPQLCPEIVSQVCARPVADPHSQQKDCAGHQTADVFSPFPAPRPQQKDQYKHPVWGLRAVTAQSMDELDN